MTSMFPGNKSTTRKPQHERQQLGMLRRQLLEQIMRGEGSGAPAYLDKHQKQMWEKLLDVYRKRQVINGTALLPKGMLMLSNLRKGISVALVGEKEALK